MTFIVPAYGEEQTTNTRASPAFSTEYTPSSTRPCTVIASCELEVALNKSCEVALQVKVGGSWITVDRRKASSAGSISVVLGVTPILTLTLTEGFVLTVNMPAGCSYRLTKSGEGTATINSITETLM